MIVTHHGPSFQRLYANKWLRRLPEAAAWLTHHGHADEEPPGWADVVADFRVLCQDGTRAPLPEFLPAPGQVWPSQMPGWSLEGFAHAREDCDDRVLRFTDPDGFRFAIALTGSVMRPDQMCGPGIDPDTGPEFAVGRFTILFPTAATSLLTQWRDQTTHLGGGQQQAVVPPLREIPDALASMAYSLPTLRDAMRDPAGWFGLPSGADWTALRTGGDPVGEADRYADAMGPGCPVGPARVLLAYAFAGYDSYLEVQRFVQVGLDPAELARWRETEVHDFDDAAILDWFPAAGGSSQARKRAKVFARAGLTATHLREWGPLYFGEAAYLPLIPRFEDAGWTAQDVTAVGHALPRPDRVQSWFRDSADTAQRVAEWTFTRPDRARAFLACGYTPEEARQAEALSEAELDAHLLMLAALRQGAPATSG